MTRAFVHFGKGNEPRLTREIPLKLKETQGSRYPQEYGYRIPTQWLVQHNDRWFRVYCARVGNAGSLYIGPRNAWIATISIDTE